MKKYNHFVFNCQSCGWNNELELTETLWTEKQMHDLFPECGKCESKKIVVTGIEDKKTKL